MERIQNSSRGQVPDLRGLFLRGHGGNSAALGIVQDDLVGPHDHIVSIRDGDGGGSGTPVFDETISPWGWVDFRATAGNNMGQETRPMNMALPCSRPEHGRPRTKEFPRPWPSALRNTMVSLLWFSDIFPIASFHSSFCDGYAVTPCTPVQHLF